MPKKALNLLLLPAQGRNGESPTMSRPSDDPQKTAPADPPLAPRQPHWAAVVLLLVGGLALAGLVSFLGSTALSS
jgi:hypothetical protein